MTTKVDGDMETSESTWTHDTKLSKETSEHHGSRRLSVITNTGLHVTLDAQCVELDRYRRFLNDLVDWTTCFGAETYPPPHRKDCFADGVVEAKRMIARMLAELDEYSKKL